MGDVDCMLPLHWACWGRARRDVIKTLLDARKDSANKIDAYGRLPIHVAAEYGVSSDLVITTLRKHHPGCINVKDGRGRTPTDVAQEMNDMTMFAALKRDSIAFVQHTRRSTSSTLSIGSEISNLPELQQIALRESIRASIRAGSSVGNLNFYPDAAANVHTLSSSTTTAMTTPRNNLMHTNTSMQQHINNGNGSGNGNPAVVSAAAAAGATSSAALATPAGATPARELISGSANIATATTTATARYGEQQHGGGGVSSADSDERLGHDLSELSGMNFNDHEEASELFYETVDRKSRNDHEQQELQSASILLRGGRGENARRMKGSNVMNGAGAGEHVAYNRRSSMLETELYRLIKVKDWEGALKRIKSTPNEAEQWHSYQVEKSTHWRLPIHEACSRQPSLEVVEALVEANKVGPLSPDNFAKLPIHLACELGASEMVVDYLLKVNPLSIFEEDRFKMTPLKCAELSKFPNSSVIIASLLMKPLDPVSRPGLISQGSSDRTLTKGMPPPPETAGAKSPVNSMSKSHSSERTLKTGSKESLMLKIQRSFTSRSGNGSDDSSEELMVKSTDGSTGGIRRFLRLGRSNSKDMDESVITENDDRSRSPDKSIAQRLGLPLASILVGKNSTSDASQTSSRRDSPGSKSSEPLESYANRRSSRLLMEDIPAQELGPNVPTPVLSVLDEQYENDVHPDEHNDEQYNDDLVAQKVYGSGHLRRGSSAAPGSVTRINHAPDDLGKPHRSGSDSPLPGSMWLSRMLTAVKLYPGGKKTPPQNGLSPIFQSQYESDSEDESTKQDEAVSVPYAVEAVLVEETETHCKINRRFQMLLGLIIVMVALCLTAFGISVSSSDGSIETRGGITFQPSPAPSFLQSGLLSSGSMQEDKPSPSPSLSPTMIRMVELRHELELVSGTEAFEDPSSSHSMTLEWLSSVDSLQVQTDDTHFLQRYVLALLYFSTHGESWADSFNWLDETHECEWQIENFLPRGVRECSNDLFVTNVGLGKL